MSPSLPRLPAAARVIIAAMLLAAAVSAQSPASAAAVTKCGALPGHTCVKLTIALFGNGSGRFQSATDGGVPTGQIDCRRSGGIDSGTCTATFDVAPSPLNTLFWLETPAAGSDACWILAGCFPNAFTTNTIVTGGGTDSDHGFRLVDPSTVTVARKGSGSGSVKSSPRGISCGGACQVAFASGQPVTLTASAAAGSVFGGWSGGTCSGKSETCTFTLTAATVIDATFNSVLKPTAVATLAPSDVPTIEPSPSAGPSEVVEAASANSSASTSLSGSSTPASPDPPSSGSDTLPIAIAIVLAALLLAAGLAIGLTLGLRSRGARPPA
jgi:hypothetical protein